MKPDFTKMELIPAIVQDYKTNEVLMLAYVNEEAYQRMLETNQNNEATKACLLYTSQMNYR